MMQYYHGTTAGGLRELSGERVYLSDNRAYSLFYIRDKELDYVTCGVRKDGTVFYEEWFPDQLRVLYDGRPGWVYRVPARDAVPGHANGVFLARGPVRVESGEYIENVYLEIQKQIAAGLVTVKRFEQHSRQELEEYYCAAAEYFRERKEKLSQRAIDFFCKNFPGCGE